MPQPVSAHPLTAAGLTAPLPAGGGRRR